MNVSNISLRVPADEHKQFKLRAVQAGRTLADILLEYIKKIASGEIKLEEVK